MDIIELSLKLEADLLESHSKDLPRMKPSGNENFSPRLTRSQARKSQNPVIEDADVPKTNNRKIDEVEKICPNKKAKVNHKNLETIYEEPILRNGNTMFLGTDRVKRSIYLDREFRIKSKQKSKLRKMKIKRLGKRIKPFKLSDEEFKSKMLRIENFINGNNEEMGRAQTDIEFINFSSNEGRSDIQNGNVELSDCSIDNINKNKNFELGNGLI